MATQNITTTSETKEWVLACNEFEQCEIESLKGSISFIESEFIPTDSTELRNMTIQEFIPRNFSGDGISSLWVYIDSKAKLRKRLILKTHKVCSRCNVNKSIDEFHNDSGALDNKSCRCKMCNNKDSLRFTRTKDGTIYRAYKSQLQRSKRKGFGPPSYTYEELKEFVYTNKRFNNIYNEWVDSGYDSMKCLSLDRIDRFKEYSLDNITVGTWQENFDRYMIHRQ